LPIRRAISRHRTPDAEDWIGAPKGISGVG
jgi:hypothetical protein